MQAAIRSYGRFLAKFYMVTAYNASEILPTGDDSEEGWTRRLTQTLRIFGGWRFAFSESYNGRVHSTDIPGISADEAEAQEFAASELAAFSAVSHEHPDLLQAYITFADHIAVDIPSLMPFCQLTTDIWAALDVTSRNFLSLVKAQPGYFAAMSGHQFEAVVAQIFRNNGFEVIQTKQSRDGGYDLRLVVPLFSKLKASYLVGMQKSSKGANNGRRCCARAQRCGRQCPP
ncbi:hypothetical protein ASE00_08475 [Sphingomonas sp. Root710]|uniref:restriction endonuclease n=1 Tax=Sphingomonas sp. Root710 TaxID=1736594 RepID=UPI0006FE92CB|nr:restriction endonuclease [Sphingomonas sp. Root710]KRB86706.1 hypothetical protein ASE00_08475 [Sphingomonas sp. Root710]